MTQIVVHPGRLVGRTSRTEVVLRCKQSAAKRDKENMRAQGKKAAHKYPIAMWRMVAEIMASLPDHKVGCLHIY
jgi:hypothetical protein